MEQNDNDVLQDHNEYGYQPIIDPVGAQGASKPEADPIGQIAHDIVQDRGISPGSDEPDEGGLSADRLKKMIDAFEDDKQFEIAQMDACEAYYHGKQWSEEQMAVHRARKQPTIWHQHIARQVNTMVGHEQRLRRDPKAYPRTPAHVDSSDSVTAALRFVNDKTNSQDQFSAAALQLFVRGIGVVYEGVKHNARGEVEHDKHWVPQSHFFYDPASERHDFADAKYMGVTKWVDEEDAIECLLKVGNPAGANMVSELVAGNSSQDDRAFRTKAGRNAIGNTKSSYVDTDRQRCRFTEIYYRHRGQWRMAYMIGDFKLHDQPSSYIDEDGFSRNPYNPLSCYIDENGVRYGVVRDMIPVQDEINYLHSRITWCLMVRQILYHEGQVEDIDKFRKEANRADGVMKWRGKGNPPEVLSLMDQLAGLRDLESQAVAHIQNLGPNASLVGQGEGVENQSGRAIIARQNAGMTEMGPVYTRIRNWKLRSYRADWAIIRQFWRSEKWLRVLDSEDGQEFVGFNTVALGTNGQPELRNNVAELDMDIIIEEGPDTVTIQEEMLQQLGQIAPGAVPPELVIELSGLPNKKKFLEVLRKAKAPPPEVVEMQKRMDQLEQMLKASEIDKNVAQSEKYRSDAIDALIGAALKPREVATNNSQVAPMDPYDSGVMPYHAGGGYPLQPPQPQPALAGDVASLSTLLQQFPLRYQAPTFTQVAANSVAQGRPNSPPRAPEGGAGAAPRPGAASAATGMGANQSRPPEAFPPSNPNDAGLPNSMGNALMPPPDVRQGPPQQ